MTFISIPPFTFSLKLDNDKARANLMRMYPQSCFESDGLTTDYAIEIAQGHGLRKYFKKQARFLCDGNEPFKPQPEEHGYAMLEWGMNFAIASNEFTYVIVHAGVLALNDNAILFPAPPGSGKSTLTLWLAFNGWRLLSDEMALVAPNSLQVVPFVRPICLKNNSIELAKKWFPEATMSDLTRNTHKGEVCHVSPPADSWAQNQTKANLRAIVFPKYIRESPLKIYQLTQAQAFGELANNAFNMSVAGQVGFDTAFKMVSELPAFVVEYSDVSELSIFLSEIVQND